MQEKTKTSRNDFTTTEKLIIIIILMLIVVLMGYLEMIIQERMEKYAMLYTAALYGALAGAILIYAEWDKENEERKRRLEKENRGR